MMNLKSKTAVLLLIILCADSSVVYSQEFTLKEALEYAFTHNPTIIIAQNKVEKAKVILKDARRKLDLNISLQLGYSPLNERRGVGLGVSQDLGRLIGGNKKEKALAEYDLASACQELILVKQQVTKEVIRTCNNLEKTKDLLKLKEQTLSDSQKSLELAKEKFNLGMISLDEFLSKQQKLRELKFDFQQAETELKEAYLVFYQAIGFEGDIPESAS